MNSISNKKLQFLLVICLLVYVLPLVSAATQADAASTITSSRAQLTNAYRSALEAEQVGANITQLTDTLNKAGLLLSQAEHAYSTGDFEASQNLASQCQNLLSDFSAKVEEVKTAAIHQANEALWITILYPSFGVLAVIVVGLAIWYLLKRKYGASGVVANESATL